MRDIRVDYPIPVISCIALHIVWGVTPFFDQDAYGSTAISALFRLFGQGTSFLCFLAAAFAIAGLMVSGRVLGLILMLPQQTLLLISAFGVIHAIILSQFADGVIRPRSFMVTDLVWAIIAATAHTVSMLRFTLQRK